MSPAAPVRVRLSLLLTEAATELEALDRVAAELAEYAGELDGPEVGRPLLAVVAVDLHDYFTAAETLFERIARHIDGALPEGARSHRELIDQMASDLPPLRSAVLTPEERAWLHDLRSFRHFFRHAYSVGLDAPRLQRHAERLAAQHAAFRRHLEDFLAFVREVRDGLGAE